MNDLQTAVRELAKRCDGALAQDGKGFSAFDEPFGKKLAETDDWSPRMARAAWEMLGKYSGQLSDYGVDFSEIEEPSDHHAKVQGELQPKENWIVRKNGGLVEFDFPKDWETNAEVKQLAGRDFDWDEEVWTAPIDLNARQILEIVYDHGFQISSELEKELTEKSKTPSAERQAELDGDTVKLFFPKDRVLMRQVKDVSGRSFKQNPARWEVPVSIESVKDLMSLFADWDFQVEDGLINHLQSRAGVWADSIRKSRALEAPPLESEDNYELFPPQRVAARYALEKVNCYIADHTGSGKSVTAISILNHTGDYPATIVCPASVKFHWAKECLQFIPGASVSVIDTTDPDTEGEVKVSGQKLPINDYSADVRVVNYDILDSHVDHLESKMLICDEMHYAKSRGAIRSKATYSLSKGASRVLALSATPMKNRPKELFYQLKILGLAGEGKPFGHYMRYAYTFCDARKGRWGLEDDGASNLDLLQQKLRVHGYVRRPKAQLLPYLPKHRVMDLTVEASNKEEYDRAEKDPAGYLYEEALDDEDLMEEAKRMSGYDSPEKALEALAKQKEKAGQHDLAELTLLRRLTGRGKIEPAIKWVKERVGDGEKVAVFAIHREVQAALREAFPGCAISSDMSPEKRQENIERFQNESDTIILSFGAAKEGIDGLQHAARTALFVELPWSPADMSQAMGRLHRHGQEEEVLTYHMNAAGTLDEVLSATLSRKGEVVDEATNASEDIIDSLLERLNS